MGKYNIKITDRAIFDLDNIASFLCENDKRYAVYVYDEIIKRINTLENMPRRYPYIQNEQLQELGYRGMFVFSYIVIYKVLDEHKAVKIVNILPARLGMDYIVGVIDKTETENDQQTQ